MSQDHPTGDALQAIRQFLVSDLSVGDTLTRIAHISVSAVPTVVMAGMALHDGSEGQASTRVYTDPDTLEIDQAQYDADRGPCLDAFRLSRPIRLDDTRDARNGDYPEFAEACLSHGVASTLSLPLHAAGGTSVGALNLYAQQPHVFDEDQQAVAAELAAAASVVLANSVAYWGAVELSEQLRQAMATRATIEQAKGVLMATSPPMGPEEAFELLKRASQRENVKLREIAQRIVDGRR